MTTMKKIRKYFRYRTKLVIAYLLGLFKYLFCNGFFFIRAYEGRIILNVTRVYCNAPLADIHIQKN